MSKESLDYEKLCCNYYSSWEDGCCMESCEYYHRDECPIIYVKELLAKKDDKISTIEKQLAEHNEYFESFSCKDFNEFQDFISTFMLTPHEEQTLIRELKQQLAEKEQQYKESVEEILHYRDRVILEHNQDKISFAVEQLNQAIKNIKKCNYKDFGIMYQSDAIAVIDNQIKQLKEME